MKAIIKRIITIICAVALFAGTGVLLRFMLTDDTASWSRLVFNDLYRSEDNIDIVFLGSSHMRYGLDPFAVEEASSLNAISLATAGQRIDGSLAALQAAVAKNDIKTVYLDIYHAFVWNGSFTERLSLTASYLVSDYIAPSVDKIRFLLNTSGKEHYANSFIIPRRNWEQLFDLKYIKDVVAKKLSSDYNDHVFSEALYYPDTNHTEYKGDGFFSNDRAVSDDNFWNESAMSSIDDTTLEITDDCDWKKTLDEIVELCRRKNIELIFVTVPEREDTLAAFGDRYQLFHEMINGFAESYNVPYYDFNLLRNEWMVLRDRSLFFDDDHLNSKGAEQFSDIFCRLFYGEDTADLLFYESFEQKLLDEEPSVLGLAGPLRSKDVLNCRIISNRDSGYEYLVSILPDGADQPVTLKAFSENKDFSIPADQHGTLTVRWREKNSNDLSSSSFSY